MSEWQRVKKGSPCKICGEPDWCAVSSDGRVARCMRVFEGVGVLTQYDKNLVPFGLVFLDESTARDTSKYVQNAEEKRADEATLDRVYRALIDALPLTPAHRESLRARGLSDDQIDAHQYRSLPAEQDRRKAISMIRRALGGEIPEDVPGVWKGRIYGNSGIVIPVRSEDGRIRALKTRADDSRLGKYGWMSNGSDDGPSSGTPAHVPVHERGQSYDEVRLTEGPLKADIATAISGILTIGTASSSTVRGAVEQIKLLGAKRVRVAIDMDATRKAGVALGLKLAVSVLREEGFEVVVETWDESLGKGIDDALLAKAAITLREGAEIDAMLETLPKPEKKKILEEKKTETKPKPKPAQLPTSGSRWFRRGDSVELAEALLSDLRATSPEAGDEAVVFDAGVFWVYDASRGVYVEQDESILLKRVCGYAGSPSGDKGKPLMVSARGAKDALLAASWQVSKPCFFSRPPQGVTPQDGKHYSTAPAGVVFTNGFVYAQGGEVVIEALSHKHRAIHALGVAYDPNAAKEQWETMLDEIFLRKKDDGSLDTEDTRRTKLLLQEWVGYTLMGQATSRAVSLVLYGVGNDGKSSIINVVRSLFPSGSVCSLAPQEWGQKFSIARLVGKRLNAVSELPEKDILDAERFKAVVAGDQINGERKNKDPFDMVCEAGHLFACNGLPPTKDQSKGFWRRFAVIACMREFTAEEAKQDLWKKVVAEELAGIAAWAIQGAARAQQLKAFTLPDSSIQTKAEWQKDSDAIRQFIEVACDEIESKESKTLSLLVDLYPAFRAWCADSGHSPMAANKFANRLKSLGYERRTAIARLYRLRLKEAWVASLDVSSRGRSSSNSKQPMN